jgi:glycosyltransferase involved in cell wall biosynthesis
MESVQVMSPMPTGNGAFILHKMIEARLTGYRVHGYNPYLTLVPPFLALVGRAEKPRVIHTTPDHAIFSFRKGTPVVLTFHNYVLDPWMRSYSSFPQRIHYATDLRLWSKMAVRRAMKIVAVSNFTAVLAQRDLGIGAPIKTIYNGIDTTFFSPPRSNVFGRNLRVLFSGNLTRRKGAHWLNAIGERLKKNVTIYYTQGLRSRKRLRPSQNLKALGPVPYERMAERYQEMDMLLLPTVREGFSLSVLEAMACGLPVVASNCSSLPEQIDHGREAIYVLSVMWIPLRKRSTSWRMRLVSDAKWGNTIGQKRKNCLPLNGW